MAGAQARLRAARTIVARQMATASYVRKWVLLGGVIGVIAGLGAVAFFEALKVSTYVFLHLLAAFDPPQTVAEGGRVRAPGLLRPWALPLVVGLGGLLSGILVYWLAPEAEGHGTDAAIHAVHENPRGIRIRTVLVKLVASALTIGSGGSGGREGPTAQISAGFGSLLARLLNLSPADGRIAVSVGIGSGIGAIFKAPLGGAVLAAEIVYRDDIETEALLPAIIASVVSYAVFGAFEGYTPIFGFVHAPGLSHPFELVWFGLIGVCCGLVGLLYAKGFYGLGDLFSRLPVTRYAKPAIGGLLVGTMALAIPQVLGTGYGWVQIALGRSSLLHMSLAIVLLLPFARIVATGFSIGSGGSGGIFGPGLVIGAFVGAGLWRLLEPIAAVPHDPSSFVVVGMMACFGSISRAPIAVMLMVAEMTGSLEVVAPAMLAVGVATLIVRRSDATIYRSQLRTRLDSPAHRLAYGLPLLSTVSVSEVMAPLRVVLGADEPAEEAADRLARRHLPGAPVVDDKGVFLGTVTVDALEADTSADDGASLVGDLVDVTAPSVQQEAAVDVALEALGTTAQTWVTVTDSGEHAIGIFTTSKVITGYRKALAASAKRVSRLAGDAVPVEARVGERAEAAGRAVRDVTLPPGTIILTIERDGGLILADGDTVLGPGDLVSALAHPASLNAVLHVLEGEERAEAPS
jgi:H+/Cl- antiporter ClcA